MEEINGWKAISSLLEAGTHLPCYAYIMTQFDQVNVSTDTKFQKKYDFFYRVRRNVTWRKEYYQVFEQ